MIILLFLVGCASTPTHPYAALPETVALDWDREALRRHMDQHLLHVQTARDATLQGDLDEARTALRWLAEHETFPGEPEAWGEWAQNMRTYASFGATANDAAEVGRAVGAIGTQCGGCHASLHVTPRTPEGSEPPAATSGVIGHAARHGWASDRLWSALILPSDVAWRDALFAIREPAISLDALQLNDDQRAATAVYVDTLALLSQASYEFDDPLGRAATYGHILSTCAGCHSAAASTGDR